MDDGIDGWQIPIIFFLSNAKPLKIVLKNPSCGSKLFSVDSIYPKTVQKLEKNYNFSNVNVSSFLYTQYHPAMLKWMVMGIKEWCPRVKSLLFYFPTPFAFFFRQESKLGLQAYPSGYIYSQALFAITI